MANSATVKINSPIESVRLQNLQNNKYYRTSILSLIIDSNSYNRIIIILIILLKLLINSKLKKDFIEKVYI